MSEASPPAHRYGFVAIVGRPNVGKSTLLNRLVGQKISITSQRPQTTRHRILGIKTSPVAQIVYVDTPGLHQVAHRAINRFMNRVAGNVIQQVDAVVLVVEALDWTREDDLVLALVKEAHVPVILAVNKVDAIPQKKALLPFLADIHERADFAATIPISASKGDNLRELEQALIRQLPEGPAMFPEEQVTDRSERFMAAEVLREKLTRRLGQEVPYRLAVEVEHFEEKDNRVLIDAVIWVERTGQKAIVIGKGGKVLKTVGEAARRDLEGLLGQKVYLQTWVKVKEGWSDDERALRRMGYQDS